MKKKKQKAGIARLIEISKSKQQVFMTSKLLTVAATIIKLVQLWLIYKITSEAVVGVINSRAVNTPLIKQHALVLIISGIVYALLRYASSRLAHRSAFEIIYDTKIALINHLNKIHLGYLDDLSLGKLEKIIMTDAEKMEGFLSHHQMDIIEVLLTAPLVLLYLFFVDIQLALALLLPIVIAVIIMAFNLANPENRRDQVTLNNEIENVQTEIIEYINGMNDIKCYDIGEKSMSEYKKSIFGLSNVILKIANIYKYIIGGFYATLNLPYLTVFLLTAYRYFTGFDKTVLISNFVLFLIAVTIFKNTFETFFILSRSMMEINERVSRIDAVLNLPIIEEPQVGKALQKYDIEFKNVYFDYGTTAILKDISFKIEQGAKLGIIGASGGGKTTIAKLIIKFLKAKAGEITIGGVNIDDIDSKTLMQHVSFVFQDSYLFKDSIMFNLTMGRAVPEQRVSDVCKMLNIHDKISRLKQGYQTVVGKDEGFFSGGEIQRIAVARILLKDSNIIVLDEATAAADTENELYLQKAFLKLARDKTVVMVAHRLKTIENADQIIVVENGEIVESGSHSALIAKKGRYHKLYNYQNQSAEMTISNLARGEILC